jgi:hypothetical protein
MLAYLDPGAGSSIAAVLAGGTAGVAVLYRVARDRVTSRLRRGRGTETDTQTGTPRTGNGAAPASDGGADPAGTADPVDGPETDTDVHAVGGSAVDTDADADAADTPPAADGSGAQVSVGEDEQSDRVRGR